MSAHEQEIDDGDPTWPWAAGAMPISGIVVGERLGVGWRCETWLSWSEALWCPVVVKVARPHQVDHPRARRALGREVAALEGLLHPAVPRLYAHDLSGPLPHVMSEFVVGVGLDEMLDRRRRGLDAAAVARLGAQLLAALMPLHARGLAHLDVKPDNVMLHEGRPILVDFGSARALGSSQPSGHPVGTLGYASPEMEACEPIAAAMDVYAVGVTLRECLGRSWLPSLSATSRRRHRALVDLVDAMTSPTAALRPSLEEAVAAMSALVDLPPWTAR